MHLDNFSESPKINGIGFKSAGDVPHRDPDIVEMKIVDVHGVEHLYNYNLYFEGKRWHIMSFIFPDMIEVQTVELIFENLGDNKEIQLGEILLYGEV